MTNPSGGPRPDAVARARAFLDDAEARLDHAFHRSDLPAGIDGASLQLAALEKLLDPDVGSLGLLNVGGVFRTFGRAVAGARAAGLVLDRSCPRIVRARLALVVATHSDETWESLVDGPLASEDDADCLPFEAQLEKELSLLVLGARTPEGIADDIGEFQDDWQESIGPRFEDVRRGLGVAASRAYAAVVLREGLGWFHRVAAEALAAEGTEEAAAILSAALDAGGADDGGVLRKAWETIRIRRAEGTVQEAPLEGECRLRRLSPEGTLSGIVAVGTGRLTRRVFLAVVDYSGSGLDVTFLREHAAERVAPAATNTLGEHLVAPLGEGLLALALAANVNLEAGKAADRAAFEALLHRAPAMREIPDGAPFDDPDELRDLVTAGALAGWQLSERDLLASRRMASFIAEGRIADADEDDDPEPEFLELCVRFGRRVQHAALEARWSGDEALSGRLWATGALLADGDPSVLMSLVARQLGVDVVQ